MSIANFTAELNNTNYSDQEPVYSNLFKEYERVVIESLITSFGLDFIIHKTMDKHGGDVDTIHNVRKIGKDTKMTYKNELNKQKYEKLSSYKYSDYHNSKSNFSKIKHEAREKWQATGKNIKDEYMGGDIGFYGRTKNISPTKKAELDHIIATNEIHNDRGRVLAQLDGAELADSDSNLAWTNKSLNASMQNKSIKEYIDSNQNIDEKTKKNLLEQDAIAREEYNHKINISYYTSKAFWQDTAKASVKIGAAMGARQVLGFIFSEIWFEVKDEFSRGKEYGKSKWKQIARAVKRGFLNAKLKYKELWDKFIEGSIGGTISSLMTTLLNAFFTTAKIWVRVIRQTWASLVEAIKILFINPDYLPLGERMKAASKIIATAASVVAGSVVSDLIAKTGIGSIPVLGEIIQVFTGSLVTGILSITLLHWLDRSPIVNKMVNFLNKLPTMDNAINYYREQSRILEEYASQLMKIDLDTFQKETKIYQDALIGIEDIDNPIKLNLFLKEIRNKLGIASPFINHNDDINIFMKDLNSKLIFK